MNWERLKRAGKPILLYGMGNGADRVLAELERHGIRPAGVFASDEFVRGQQFHGMTVITYAEAKARFGDMIVLVAFGTNRPEVLARIDAIDAEQELYAPDFPVAGEQRFTEDYAAAHRQELDAVFDRLADEPSKRVFENTIRYKLTGDISYLKACESDPEEAYRNILRLEPGEVYTDLGAYRGDTIAEFLRYCPDYAGIYAFEPDGYTFRRLAENTKTLQNCVLLNKAAGEGPGTILFSQRGGRNSSADAGGRPVETESVDHLMQGGRVSFLNIDVEGQERAALAGAAETIRKYKPKLLVAAYHRTEDLFAIPAQVLALRPDYRVYLRHFPQIPAWDTNFYFV